MSPQRRDSGNRDSEHSQGFACAGLAAGVAKNCCPRETGFSPSPVSRAAAGRSRGSRECHGARTICDESIAREGETARRDDSPCVLCGGVVISNKRKRHRV